MACRRSARRPRRVPWSVPRRRVQWSARRRPVPWSVPRRRRQLVWRRRPGPSVGAAAAAAAVGLAAAVGAAAGGAVVGLVAGVTACEQACKSGNAKLLAASAPKRSRIRRRETGCESAIELNSPGADDRGHQVRHGMPTVGRVRAAKAGGMRYCADVSFPLPRGRPRQPHDRPTDQVVKPI